MARLIDFQFLGYDNVIVAELLDEEEPTYAEKVWQDVETPLKMWIWHTTSSGDWFSSKARPPLHPSESGTQAMPIGRRKLMCDVDVGSILYPGSGTFSYCYGPDVTEPLPARGPVVARAVDPDEFYRAGLHTWNAQYRTHELVTVTASRHGADDA